MKLLKLLIFFGSAFFFVAVIRDSIHHIIAEFHHRNGFIKMDRYPKLANADFKAAASLAKWETHYRLQLAKSYETTAGQYPEEFMTYMSLALAEYEQLITDDPINPWFKARIGLIYHELFKKNPTKIAHKKAAHDYAKAATDSDPKNPLFTLHYGHLLYTYNQTEMAKKYYLKTIDYDPDITEAHFNIAAIYNEENNVSAAISHYKTVSEHLLKLEKNYRRLPTNELKNKIEKFQNARIAVANDYIKKKDLTNAYELINLIPVSVEKYELIAEYYTLTNQKAAAISIYNELNEKLNTKNYTLKIKQLINE